MKRLLLLFFLMPLAALAQQGPPVVVGQTLTPFNAPATAAVVNVAQTVGAPVAYSVYTPQRALIVNETAGATFSITAPPGTMWQAGQVVGFLRVAVGSVVFRVTSQTFGSCGDATHSCSLTVNAQGQVTSLSNNVISGGGGGGSPGGTSGQLQYNNAGAFGGFTMASDCTITVPNIICTKTNGSAFAASATTDTTNASNIASGTLNVARIPTAIPIGSIGSAGLSGTSPIAINSAGAISCTTCSTSTGTVTSVATSSPITGGPFSTTGTIGCATCVTSAASLTANALMLGAGSQGSQVLGSLGTTTTLLHGNAAGAPTFGAVNLAADVTGQLPIGAVGSAGLSGTSPVAISSGGAISCATCSTNASALTANEIVLGGGSQALTVLASLGTTTTVVHGNAAGAPAFAVVTPSDAAGNTSGSGNFCLVSNCAMTTPNLGTPSAVNLTNGTALPAASVASGALANGMTATTQAAADNSTKLATTAYVDSKAVKLTTGTSVSLTAPTAYFICTGTCTVTPPVPVAGYQFCAANTDNVATVITFAALGSSARYENQVRTAYGTAGTGTFVSSGAIGDQACIVGLDSTHYLTLMTQGTWTAN